MNTPATTKQETTSYNIVGAAIEVINSVGPGFAPEIYKNAMMIELARQGLKFTDDKVSITHIGQALGSTTLFKVEDVGIVFDCSNTKPADRTNCTAMFQHDPDLKLMMVLNFLYSKLSWAKFHKQAPAAQRAPAA